MRRRLLAFTFAALLPGAVSAQAEQALALSDQVNAKVITWRRDIHQHPELGNRETRTAALVAAHLRALGLEVKTGVATTGVIAVLKGSKPGPRIALRADMDALPITENSGLPFASKVTSTFRGEAVGVMHACGHDAHTSILMGVAEALASVKNDLPGEVLFVFQPAEEGVPDGEDGGATEMLAQGVFSEFKPDAVFGLHVMSMLSAGTVGYRAGPFMAAADRFNIKITGRQTHGAMPWNGVDPIVAAAEVITSAQSIVSRRQNISKLPVVVSFGAIKGGVRFNIIPNDVEMIGTIRTFDEGVRQAVFADLKNVATHVSAAHGASAEVKVPDAKPTPVLINNPALAVQSRKSLERAMGAANVIDISLQMGAEDFAEFAHAAPGFFFFVGATPKDQDLSKAPSNHSPEFFLDETALTVGTRSLLQVSLDFLHGVK